MASGTMARATVRPLNTFVRISFVEYMGQGLTNELGARPARPAPVLCDSDLFLFCANRPTDREQGFFDLQRIEGHARRHA